MAIEGITKPSWTYPWKVAHSRRKEVDAVAMNIYGEQDMKIFGVTKA